MIPYPILALFSITCLALVHLWAGRTRKLPAAFQAKFLSAGGGVAIAYIFIDLLPKLSISDQLVTKAFEGVFPYFERHVYILALCGFLLFFIVGRSNQYFNKRTSFWLSLSSYAFFNFLMGYAIEDINNPEVQPLALFTLAMSLHFFTNDYSISKSHPKEYALREKWILIISLFLGWATGIWFTLSETAVALVSAFIAGGVIMNVTRHELPEENPNNLASFILFTLFYTAILLSIG